MANSRPSSKSDSVSAADSEGSGPAAQHVPAGFLCACYGYLVGLHTVIRLPDPGPSGDPRPQLEMRRSCTTWPGG
jgi:hypothetical protein